MNEVTPSGFGRLEREHEELKSRLNQLIGSSQRVANATERIDVSLHDHFLALLTERHRQYMQLFEAHEKAVDSAMKAAREAIQKAEAASEKRFDSVNEFRGTLSDQAAKLMPRAEAEQVERSLAGKIDALTTRLDKIDGSETGASKLRTILISIAGLAATVAIVFLSFIAKRP